MNKRIYSTDEVRKLLRERQGTRTASQMADEIGVSKAYISRVYAGREDPGPSIQRYLGIKQIPLERKYEVA